MEILIFYYRSSLLIGGIEETHQGFVNLVIQTKYKCQSPLHSTGFHKVLHILSTTALEPLPSYSVLLCNIPHTVLYISQECEELHFWG